MHIKSIFEHGERIPKKYTADGINVNPSLEISNIPKDAKSLVLIIDDPDAPSGDWVHWIVWNISPSTTLIKENSVPLNSIQGINNFGTNNYKGPSPPSGTHRYMFKLYALNIILNLPRTSEKKDVEIAMQKHIIDKAILQGNYSRM